MLFILDIIIDDMESTHNKFASCLGINVNDLDLLLEGKFNINNDIARKLSVMMGSSIDLWINLQKDYDETIFKIKQQKDFEEQASGASCIDYSL